MGADHIVFIHLSDFLLKLAFLYDIFEKLLALNLSLQGNNMHILKIIENIVTFKGKLICGTE